MSAKAYLIKATGRTPEEAEQSIVDQFNSWSAQKRILHVCEPWRRVLGEPSATFFVYQMIYYEEI